MENKMLDDPNRKYVPKKEFITYSVSALGQGMIYAIMSSYISDFYLNVLRVTPIFVLLLMFLARIWDAINDPLMGMIMDAHEPIPFVVLAIDSILPRSEGFGVIAFGRLQNGTSDIVYIIPHKTYVTDAYIIFAVIEISGA